MSDTVFRKSCKAKGFRMIVFLLLLMLCPGVLKANALSVTATPLPSDVPLSDPFSIMGCYTVELLNDGVWSTLEKEMIAVQTNQGFYDGVLMFVPLSEFVEQEQIPEIKLSKDFTYRVTAPNPDTALVCSHTIYDQAWEIILNKEDPEADCDWNKLDPGKYLMSIRVSATIGENHASTASLLWLIIGDCDEAEQGAPLFAPIESPVPTPAP